MYELQSPAPAAGRDVATFDPMRSMARIATLDAAIAAGPRMASQIQNWDDFVGVVDKKIDEQVAFIRWWDANVRRDGRPGRNGDRTSTVSAGEAESITGISKEQVSKWRKRLTGADGAVDDKKVEAYKARLLGPTYKAFMALRGGEGNHLAMGSGENEWYTPKEYIEDARETMGEIDLDPASNPEANETVNAAQYYTAEDSGLEKEWGGNVWMNPPYSRDLMPAFCEKLKAEYLAGRVKQAIVVAHNNTDTRWFQSLSGVASAVCFPATRIKFYRGENVASPVNGQVFIYLGADPGRFRKVFSKHGVVLFPAGGDE